MRTVGTHQRLAGWRWAPWHTPRLIDGAQPFSLMCGQGGGGDRKNCWGNPHREGQARPDFLWGLPWGPQVGKLPLCPTPPSQRTACLSRPYPLRAPAELVLRVPQGHRILTDIIGHTHHLEQWTPHAHGDPWAPHPRFSGPSLDTSPAKLPTSGPGQPPPPKVSQVWPKKH